MALARRVPRQNNLCKNSFGNRHGWQSPYQYMIDFTGTSTGDLGSGGVEYSGTYSHVASGASGPCGTINAYSGGEYLVMENTDTSPYNIMSSGHYNYTASGGSDFLNAPPYPAYQGPFTECLAIYIPVSGTGAWTQTSANCQFEFDFQGCIGQNQSSYAAEIIIDCGVTTTGQVGFYNCYGGDMGSLGGTNKLSVSSVNNGHIANVTSNGWYIFNVTYVWSGNFSTDSWIAIEQIFDSNKNLVGYFVVPGNAQGPSYSTGGTFDAVPMASDGGTGYAPSTSLIGPDYGGFMAYWVPGFGASGGFSANGNVCVDHYGWFLGYPNPTMRPIIQNKYYNISAPHGTSWSMQIIATNTPTSFQGYFKPAFSSHISCNTSTGIISGTTPAAGVYQFVIACGNQWGCDARRFQLTVT